MDKLKTENNKILMKETESEDSAIDSMAMEQSLKGFLE